jgi:hypothetical protein
MDTPNKTANQHHLPHDPEVPTTDDPVLPPTRFIHVPDFKDPALSLAITSGDFEPCKQNLHDSNWMTPDLRQHVESLFPGRDAIDNGTGVRDTVAFKRVCSIIFEKGRVYASSK